MELGITLGEAVIKYAFRVWVGPAVDIGDSVLAFANKKLMSRLEQRKLERFFDVCVDAVAERSIEFLRHEGVRLPGNELTAAVLAVETTFSKAEISDLFRNDLDAKTLERSLEASASAIAGEALLSEAGAAFFTILLSEACAYAIEFASTLPTYQNLAFREILRRQTLIWEQLSVLLSRLPERDATDEFLTYYRRLAAKRFDRMELFGVDFSDRVHSHYPLTVAFINLSAIRRSNVSNVGLLPTAGSLRVERAISEDKRLLIVGEAGSGKTTLLRWLAVQASRRSFGRQLDDWNSYVPFVIPLRHFADRGLPALDEFPAAGLRNVFGPAPTPTWTHDLLTQGRALILVDGVDELPHGRWG